MNQSKPEIRAYIDGANLHKGIKSLGWKLHYGRFRSWLRQKYGVSEARIFIGHIPKHVGLYSHLQKSGYHLTFKEVVYGASGAPKGNCDADLVLQVVRDIFEVKLDRVVIVSSDGDYASLVRFLGEKCMACTIISPAKPNKCSMLLKRTGTPILYLQDIRRKVEYNDVSKKEKAPDADVSA